MIRQCPYCARWLHGLAAKLRRCPNCRQPLPSPNPTEPDRQDLKLLHRTAMVDPDFLIGSWADLDRSGPPPHEPTAAERTRR